MNHLDKLGDRSWAVDLPGHGNDHSDRAKVTLDVYIDGVVKFIERHDLRDFVLAGHSMGGLVLPGVVARIPERIKRVVFVSAFVVNDGEAAIDPTTDRAKALIEFANSRPDKSLPIEAMADQFRQYFIQDGTRELQDFVMSGLCPQPIAPLVTPVAMRAFHEAPVPHSYVVCKQDLVPDGEPQWHPTFSGRLKNPTIRFIDCGHEVMFTQPVACAQALHELANS